MIVVLLAAASMYERGEISIGTITAFVLYLIQLFDPIGRFTEWLGEFRQGLAALAKIVGLLQVPTPIEQKPDAVELPREGLLALRDVTFGYAEGRPVVRELTLELHPGEHVALVGATPNIPEVLPPEVEASIRASMVERDPTEAQIPLPDTLSGNDVLPEPRSAPD